MFEITYRLDGQSLEHTLQYSAVDGEEALNAFYSDPFLLDKPTLILLALVEVA